MSWVNRSSNPKSTGGEASISDIFEFFRLNWKLLGLLTLIFSVVAVALSLVLIPTQYSKTMTLSITQAPGELLSRLGQPPLDSDRAGNQAEDYLEEGEYDSARVTGTYDEITEQIEVTLRAGDRATLQAASAKVVEQLESGFREAYEESLGVALGSRLANLEAEEEINREILERLERSPATDENLQVQRATTLLEMDRIELERADLERSREDLSRAAEELVSINIVSESNIQRSSPATKVAFAVAMSFAAAVVVAIIRTALRGK